MGFFAQDQVFVLVLLMGWMGIGNPAQADEWPKLDARIGTVVTGKASDANTFNYPIYARELDDIRTRTYHAFTDAIHLGFQTLEVGSLSAGICKASAYAQLPATLAPTCEEVHHPSPSLDAASLASLTAIPLAQKLTPTLADFATSDYFRGLFSQDLKTLIVDSTVANALSANNFAVNKHATDPGLSVVLGPDNLFLERALEATTNEYYHLALTLLTQYAGSGKTFIIMGENEMDWALRGANAAVDQLQLDGKLASRPDCSKSETMARYPEVCAPVRNIINYWNAIQHGISLAREASPAPGVRVLHGCELNQILASMPTIPDERGTNRMVANKDYRANGVSVVRDVVPHTHCDYYGYSAYDYGSRVAKFSAAIDFLKAAMDQNGSHSGFFISELGVSENAAANTLETEVSAFVESAIQSAFAKGATHFTHWSLYDNSCVTKPDESKGEVLNTLIDKQDKEPRLYCAGAWMRKPDGDLSKIFTMLQKNHLAPH